MDIGLYGNTTEATPKLGEFQHCACLGMTLSGTLSADEVWVPACNPYRLQGPLTVPAGVTLTISPGTVVEGGTADSAITVDGLLLAEGQSGQNVLFQGYSGAPWAGLDLRGAGAHTLLFAEVREADRVCVASSSARVERSRFIENTTALVVDPLAAPQCWPDRLPVAG